MTNFEAPIFELLINIRHEKVKKLSGDWGHHGTRKLHWYFVIDQALTDRSIPNEPLRLERIKYDRSGGDWTDAPLEGLSQVDWQLRVLVADPAEVGKCQKLREANLGLCIEAPFHFLGVLSLVNGLLQNSTLSHKFKKVSIVVDILDDPKEVVCVERELLLGFEFDWRSGK